MSTVAKIMNKKPKSVGPKASIASAAKTMPAISLRCVASMAVEDIAWGIMQ